MGVGTIQGALRASRTFWLVAAEGKRCHDKYVVAEWLRNILSTSMNGGLSFGEALLMVRTLALLIALLSGVCRSVAILNRSPRRSTYNVKGIAMHASSSSSSSSDTGACGRRCSTCKASSKFDSDFSLRSDGEVVAI